jgi:MFS family permease
MADAAVAPLTRTRGWVNVAFALQGVMLALVLTNLPGLKERTGIGDSEVSLVVLTVLVFAAGGSLFAGWLAPRFGSALVLVAAFALQAAGLFLLAIDLGYGALFPVFAVFGLGVGFGDAGIGMQGLTVQRAYGRSIINTFFAFQTAAAILGALLVAGINVLHLDFELGFLIGGAIAIACLPWLLRGLARDPEQDAAPTHKRPLPWRTLTLFGLVVAVVYIGDGVVSTWSSVYLEDTLLAAAAIVPLGYAAYQGAVLIARLFGDRFVIRRGRAAVISGAVVLAAVGLTVSAIAPAPWIAVVGFAITGLGLGVIVPITFAAAGDVAPEQMDEIVSRLNLFNYVGVVVGSALTGVIADAVGMRWAIIVPAVLILGILTIASRYNDRVAAPAAPSAV